MHNFHDKYDGICALNTFFCEDPTYAQNSMLNCDSALKCFQNKCNSWGVKEGPHEFEIIIE